MTSHQWNFTYMGAVDPSIFVGRKDQIRSIYDCLTRYRGGGFAIVGESLVGKTSLLRYLMQPKIVQCWELDPDRVHFVEIDCSEMLPFSVDRFWQHVLKSLSLKLPAELREQAINLSAAAQADSIEIRDFFNEVFAQGRLAVLLLDEYEASITTRKFEPTGLPVKLGALLNNTRGLGIVITTQRPLDELSEIESPISPWQHRFQELKLHPFTDEELEEYFARFCPELRVDEQKHIRKLGGRHPRLLQLAGYLLVQLKEDHPGGKFRRSDLERRFREAAETQFSALWRISSAGEQMLLVALARRSLTPGLIHSNSQLHWRRLTERGLLEGDRIFSPVFEQFILERSASGHPGNENTGYSTMKRRDLNEIIVRYFSKEELEVLCADVQQVLEDQGIKDVPVNPEIVGGSGKPNIVLNLITYLERRGHLGCLEAAVRRMRPNAFS